MVTFVSVSAQETSIETEKEKDEHELVPYKKETFEGERTATINAMWVNPNLPKDDERAAGVMKVTIRVRENSLEDENQQRVALVSCATSRPNVENSSWEATAWIAAFAACRELGENMANYEFSLQTPEPIDGPSASLAISATMLALIQGVDVPSDWAMTGTVGPDGIVGPVDGIEQKLIAAAKKGVKRIGFPSGQRLVYNKEMDDFTDLVVIGKKLGLEEVIEIDGIESAYKFITGKKLRTKWSDIPVTMKALDSPSLTDSSITRLKASIRDLVQSHKTDLEEAQRFLGDRITVSKERKATAENYLESATYYYGVMTDSRLGGSLAQSYFNGLRSKALIQNTNYYTELMEPVTSIGRKDMSSLRSVTKAYFRIWKEVESARRSLDDTISEASAGGSFYARIEGLNATISSREGAAFQSAAKEMFRSALIQLYLALDVAERGNSKTILLTDNYFDSLAKTAEYFAMAKTRYIISKDWYAFSLLNRNSADVPVKLHEEFYTALGSTYHKGAESSLAYIDASMAEKWQDEFKASLKAQGRTAFMLNFKEFPHQRAFVEGRYLPLAIATRSADRVNKVEKIEGIREWMENNDIWNESFAVNYDESISDFGSGASGLLGLSSIIFKHYNYGNSDVRMRRSRSFGIVADKTREKARLRVAQLKFKLAEKADVPYETVEMPAAIALNMELADSLRYGDSDDMTSSLMVYWRATMLCDLGLMMVEHSGK